MTKPAPPNAAAADAFMAALGFRRVVRPTSEQMLKAMAQAADEQRRVLVGAGTTATQKPRVGALKRAPGAGRKPLADGIVRVNLSLTPAHREQLKALGGSAWVRKMLDAVCGVEKKD